MHQDKVLDSSVKLVEWNSSVALHFLPLQMLLILFEFKLLRTCDNQIIDNLDCVWRDRVTFFSIDNHEVDQVVVEIDDKDLWLEIFATFRLEHAVDDWYNCFPSAVVHDTVLALPENIFDFIQPLLLSSQLMFVNDAIVDKGICFNRIFF